MLDCHFTPDAPNREGTGDTTCIATAEGWLFLAVVIDLFNREVVDSTKRACPFSSGYLALKEPGPFPNRKRAKAGQ